MQRPTPNHALTKGVRRVTRHGTSAAITMDHKASGGKTLSGAWIAACASWPSEWVDCCVLLGAGCRLPKVVGFITSCSSRGGGWLMPMSLRVCVSAESESFLSGVTWPLSARLPSSRRCSKTKRTNEPPCLMCVLLLTELAPTCGGRICMLNCM